MQKVAWSVLLSIIGPVSHASMCCGQEDWTQFRGTHGTAVSNSTRLPTTWGGVFDRPDWKIDLPGRGWSSPIVVGDRIWITTAVETSMDKTSAFEKLADRPYGVDDFQTHASVQLFAIELNATTGEIVRKIELFQADSPAPIHALNSYASPTPCSDGRRVICHFGSLGTACIDVETGDVLWKRIFRLEDVTGSGTSPILYRGLVYLACDGSDQQFIVALDSATGETRWESNRPAIDVSDVSHYRSFSTPILLEHTGKSQLVSMAAQWLISYDPKTGEELWKARISDGFAAVPSPSYSDGVVVACTGFWKHELVAVRVDGSGDVSDSHVVWRHGRQVPDVSSPLVLDGLVYFVSSIGIATCLDASSGEQVWQTRLGGNYSASPIASRTEAGKSRIYFTSREGVTTIVASGRSFIELSKNTLYGETLASLAVSRDRLLIRTLPTLYCIGSP